MGLLGLLFDSHSVYQMSPVNPQASRKMARKTLVLDQGSANSVLQGKIDLLPHLSVYILSIISTRKELNSGYRDHMAHKAKNMYYLFLDRKSLLTSMLNEFQIYSLLSYSIISFSKTIYKA